MRRILYVCLTLCLPFFASAQNPSAVTKPDNSVDYVAGNAGAIHRDLGARLFDYITPFDYGAVGDGSANDTQALQKAIRAAQAQGKTLNLLGATYKTMSALYCYPDSGKTFTMVGNGAILDIQSNGLIVTPDSAATPRCGNVVIEGVTFRAPRVPVDYDSQNYIKAIFAQKLERIEVRRCRFRNIYGNGIHVKDYCKSGVIDGNLLESVFGKTDVYTADSIIDNYGDGISLEKNIYNVTVSNNVLILSGNQLGRCGISVDYYCRDISVDNNSIYGYDRSIHVETSSAVTVRGNKINRSYCGIYVYKCHDIGISENLVDGSMPLREPKIGTPGLIYTFDSDRITVTNNIFRNWTPSIATSYTVKIWGNDILFNGNYVDGGTLHGFGDNFRNKFVDNTFNRLEFLLGKTVQSTVERNRFFSSKLDVRQTQNAIVSGNDFMPHPDSSFAEKVIVYFVKGLLFNQNRIYSPKEYFVDDYQNISYTFGHNMLFRKKSTDGSRIFRYGNSARNPLMFTAYPDLLKDEVTGSTRPLGTYVDADTAITRQFATKTITKRATVSTTSATTDVVISLGTTFPVVYSIQPTWTPALQSLNTTEVVPQIVGTHVDASGRVYEVKVRLTRNTGTGTTTNGTVSVAITGTE